MSGGGDQIDWLVLTAANQAQAQGYRAQLAARERDGRLSGVRKWMVVPDPGDRRVGSGGSTLVVLHELARRLRLENRGERETAALFAERRILVIHSGGDSRRLPAYAAEGKVFTPLPCDTPEDEPATLFDLVLADLAAIPIPDEGRVVIATGDVLLGVGKHAPDMTKAGMVGVAFPGAADVGSRHGVYVRGKDGRVADFLQKPDRDTARRRGALDSRGRVLIDTGVLGLDPRTAAAWVEAGRGLVRDITVGRASAIDLYQGMLPALVSRDESGLAKELGALCRRLRGVRFHVTVVPSCDFLHIGSTRELVQVVARNRRVRRAGLGTGPTAFNCAGRRAGGTPRLDHLKGPRDSLIEASRIDRPIRLGHGSVLVGFPGGSSFEVPDGWGMVFLPVGERAWSCVAFGIGDDFKTPRDQGGTIGGQRIDAWLKRVGVSERQLFLSACENSLWFARLWMVGELKDVLQGTVWVMRGRGRLPRGWLAARRLSLAELMPRVNLVRLMEQRTELQREERLDRAVAAIDSGAVPALGSLMRAVRKEGDAAKVARAIQSRVLRRGPHFERARLYRAASALAGAFPRVRVLGRSGAALDEAAFACIAEGVARSVPTPPSQGRAAIRHGQAVRVSCPVRIDLCGGWSDTPPICHEVGGTVVNAAITLNGEQPVRVSARLLDEPVIRLRSDDLKRSVTIANAGEARGHHDPHDWAALPKAALMLAGITPRRAGASLAKRMTDFGGGLQLTMSAAVPKGSGLGTSSILGAAVLACLDRVCGRRGRGGRGGRGRWGASVRSLIERTSVLEQMMSTAGGWQDQAGGITPGIKILRTRPGTDQVPRVEGIAVPARAMRELRDRSVLYYTGQRRLAKDILQGVVRRYLSGDAEAVRIVQDLKAAAEEMACDLARGDVDAFARGVLRNWELKKAIDPGSTNARIEAILRPLVARLSGYELAGAGGGGFIFMIARSRQSAAAVRDLLSRGLGSSGARLVDFDVDAEGLSVEVVSVAKGEKRSPSLQPVRLQRSTRAIG